MSATLHSSPHPVLLVSSKSQAQVPAALHLQSSATLGTGRALTHAELLEKEEHQEVKRAIEGGPANHKKRKRPTKTYAFAASDSEGELSDAGMLVSDTSAKVPEEELGKTRTTPVVIVDSGFSTIQEKIEPAPSTNLSYIGSALKQAPDGSLVAPRLVKRTAKTKTVSSQA